MKVYVLSYADEDMKGILGICASPGAVIELFVQMKMLTQEETKIISKQVCASFAMLKNRRAIFCWNNFLYSIEEHTVQE